MVNHGQVTCRHDPSDAGRDFVQPLLPRTSMGRPRLDSIMCKLRTGVAWRDVPERYGSRTGLHTRFRHWVGDGTFGRMLKNARAAQTRNP
nr:transposase [Streptomyces halstedii]